jgi:hypothetical protein
VTNTYDYRGYQYTIFDCTNTVLGLTRNRCEGDRLLPKRFYNNCIGYPYPCHICDVGSYVTIPDGMIGEYTCGDLAVKGNYGLISPDVCHDFISLAETNCGCKFPEVPSNDICDAAIPLAVSSGELIVGTTTGATKDSFIDCFAGESEVEGVWYV